MKNIFIFGASIVHGVGGENGGWADKIKHSLHSKMYGPQGAGETYEVYELGIPGKTLDDLLERFPTEMRVRIGQKDRPEDTYIIFSAGTNDSKSVDAADNHLATPEDFAAKVHAFVHLAKEFAHTIIGVGLTPVDEAKTTPKTSPLSGRQSYFSNQRLQVFEAALQSACNEQGIEMIPLLGQMPSDWVQNFLFTDGLHPNDKGHEWIRAQVEPVLLRHL